MGSAVDHAIRAAAKRVHARDGETKKGAAVAILKSKGVLRQAGKHLAMARKRKGY